MVLSERRATINDVAREAGVSRAAVSKVIRDAYGVSPAMRDRVERAIQHLDYRPSVSARGMRGATFTIGVELPDLANPFFGEVLKGIAAATSAGPYQLVVAPADSAHQEGYRAIQALIDRRVDGIVAISPLAHGDWLEEVSRSLPLVTLGRHDPSRGYDTVAGEDTVGATLVVRHLISRGFRRIAHLTHEDPGRHRGSRTPHALRVSAYERVMADSGLSDAIHVVVCGPGESGATDGARRLLSHPDRPDAVFAAHDELAMGVLRALADDGLSTADIAVAGYDDIPVAGHPLVSLTTVDQQGEEMGREAGRLLLERLAGRSNAVHFRSQPSLVVRSSTTKVSNA